MVEIDETLRSLSDGLVALSVRRKLPGEAVYRIRSGLKAADYLTLINQASVLALSDEPSARTLAYEIATHSLGLKDEASPELVGAVDFLLARLGNFPGRWLLRQRYPGAEKFRSPPLLRLEASARQRENTVPEFGKPLTDFQADLLHTLSEPAPVSVSAPTSAGKSFVLSLQILRRLRSRPGARVAYIVPTRALIREVMLRLRQELVGGGLGGASIRCVPQPALPEDVPEGVIYVLTQERLLSLLYAAGDTFGLELMVVDEAHGIGEGARGILLQTAVEHVLKRSPKVELVFASPPIGNPEVFLDLFTKGAGRIRRERHSPVAQNFILIEGVRKQPDRLKFELIRGDRRIDLGERCTSNLGWRVGCLKRRAQIAALVTGERDGCLVYANGAWEAEEIANDLTDMRPEGTIHPEVQDFIDYISEQIHDEYPLISALRRGVAFHHGEMPATVRAGVEDLFRQRKLRFISCTSTLLQGVNLPARHLVAEKPRRGNGHPLTGAEFTNLAGRAGRLMREFHGNVWCVNPGEWNQRPHDSIQVVKVASAFDKALADPMRLMEAAKDPNFDDRSGLITATLGRILSEHILPNAPLKLPANHPAEKDLELVVEELKSLRLALPPDVFARNSAVLPLKLEKLYERLTAEADIEAFVPTHPFQDDSFERLQNILKLLQEVFDGKTHFGYRFDATLSLKWMKQHTLREIIEARRTWQIQNNRPLQPIGEVIRTMIQAIERRIRFKLVRSLRAYHDVLHVALLARGMRAEAEHLIPLHVYMECGASNSVVLNLISLGFSRTSALVLYKTGIFPQESSPERCRHLVTRWFNDLKIPVTVRREAEQLLGISAKKAKTAGDKGRARPD